MGRRTLYFSLNPTRLVVAITKYSLLGCYIHCNSCNETSENILPATETYSIWYFCVKAFYVLRYRSGTLSFIRGLTASDWLNGAYLDFVFF